MQKRMNNLFDLQSKRGEQKFYEGVEACFLCGRSLGDDPYYVEIGVDGFEFGATDETESQGAFAIGSTCAKKFPTARPMMVVDDEVEIGVDGDAVIDEFEVAFVN